MDFCKSVARGLGFSRVPTRKVSKSGVVVELGQALADSKDNPQSNPKSAFIFLNVLSSNQYVGIKDVGYKVWISIWLYIVNSIVTVFCL